MIKRESVAILCTGLALYSAFLTLRPFIGPIVWAVTLSVVAYPLVSTFEQRFHSPSVCAAVVTGLVGITVIVPSIWVAHSLCIAAVTGLDSLNPHALRNLIEKVFRESPDLESPDLARAMSSIYDLLHRAGVLTRTSSAIAALTESFVGTSLRAIGHSLLMLFIIFFLLRDRTFFRKGLEGLIPLSEPDTRMVLERVTDTIHATLLGMIAVAALQGALGALLLLWLGINGVIVWGTIMALLALVPYLGTFIVWIPIAVSLGLRGDWINACLTVLWGGLVIGLSDNVLYPHVVGQRLHYHSLVVFFFLLGGVLAFGAAGAILGPVTLAVTERLLWIWRREAARHDP
jgi:predicted PurR-regulated permease PerM